MSKIRVSEEEIHSRLIVAKIRFGMLQKDVSANDLAKAACISKQTLYNRFHDPIRFSLFELRRISKKLGVSYKWLVSTTPIDYENADRIQ